MFSGIYFIKKNSFQCKIAVMFFVAIFIQNCAEPENNDTVEDSTYQNTLNNQTVGDGSSGAIDDYSTVIKINPNDSDAFFNRAKVKKEVGDIKGACEDLRKAANLGDEEANKLLQDYYKFE